VSEDDFDAPWLAPKPRQEPDRSPRRDVIADEIDRFSIDVLGWNRDKNERSDGQRRPSEILADTERWFARREWLQKRIGAGIMVSITVIFTTLMTAMSPMIFAWFKGHM
jgi:hypothetical protein